MRVPVQLRFSFELDLRARSEGPMVGSKLRGVLAEWDGRRELCDSLGSLATTQALGGVSDENQRRER